MKIAKIFVLAATWAASLLGVGLMAQGGRGANAKEPQPAPTVQIGQGQPVGPIITGENIGFQRFAAAPDRDGKIIGVLKVRIDGEWFEVTAPIKLVRTR